VFLQKLRALSYVEGKNLILERRSAEGRFERTGEITAELVGLRVDVIVTVNDRLTRAAKAVTDTVPIVMTSSIDPSAAGWCRGATRRQYYRARDHYLARGRSQALELLREMLPRVSRVAYLDSQVIIHLLIRANAAGLGGYPPRHSRS